MYVLHEKLQYPQLQYMYQIIKELFPFALQTLGNSSSTMDIKFPLLQ